MKFKITLKKKFQENSLLPINYQYSLSSWIYKILENADEDYSVFLHNQGYQESPKSKRNFKMFCFSNLFIHPFAVEGDRIRIDSNYIHFYISFYLEEASQNFVMGLFKDQHCGLGDKISQVDFKVSNVEIMPVPEFEESMEYVVTSAMVVSEKRATSPTYLSPNQVDFSMLFLDNLFEKYKAIHRQVPLEWQEARVEFGLLEDSRLRSQLITIKSNTEQETKIRGFSRFKFQLIAPKELHEILWFCGGGKHNSQGFGMVDLPTMKEKDKYKKSE